MSFKDYEDKIKDLKARQEAELAELEKQKEIAFASYKEKLNRRISNYFLFDGTIKLEYDREGWVTGYDGYCLIRNDENDSPGVG